MAKRPSVTGVMCDGKGLLCDESVVWLISATEVPSPLAREW